MDWRNFWLIKWIIANSEFFQGISTLGLMAVAPSLYGSVRVYLGDTTETPNPRIFWIALALLAINLAMLVATRSKVRTVIQMEGELTGLQNLLEGYQRDEEEREEDIKEIINFIVKYIGEEKLEMGKYHDNSERISLYVYDQRGFFPQSRYSANPELAKIRRPRYPPGQGAIWEAWQHGEYFREYPDVAADPEGYYNLVMECENIPREEAEQLSMKPQMIYGRRIGANENPLAVIIVESKAGNRYTEKRLHTTFEQRDVKICTEILKRIGMPDPKMGAEWEEAQ